MVVTTLAKQMLTSLIGKGYLLSPFALIYCKLMYATSQAFFGSNYQTLLNIKQKYDPVNVFNVYKGVGWTEQSDSSYRCYAQAWGRRQNIVALVHRLLQ